MALVTELKQNWKEEKVLLNKTISSLNKCLADYKVERKSEWKAFKSKFNDDMETIQKSLKEISVRHKKQTQQPD